MKFRTPHSALRTYFSFLLSVFCFSAVAQTTTNNPGVPIFGAGGTASGLQFVFVNGLGTLASPANFASQNSGAIVTSSGATNASGSHVTFRSDKPISLVIQGDSLSSSVAGCNLTNLAWPYQLLTNTPLWGRAQFTNFALSGDHASNMVYEYTNGAHTLIPAQVANGQSVYFFCFAGINDIKDASGATKIAFQSVSNLWRAARLDGAKVVAFTIPYYWASPNVDYTNFNIMIRNATNLWDYLVEPLHVLSSADSCDNLHYSLPANVKLAQEVYQSIFLGGNIQPRFTPSILSSNIQAAKFPWAAQVQLCAANLGTGSLVTNIGSGNQTPTFNAFDAVFFTTNQTVQYFVIDVPYGLGWTSLEMVSTWEGEVAAATSTITPNWTILRFPGSGRVVDATITSPVFSVSAATLTTYTNTITFADDTSPRQILFMLNNGIPVSYGKQKLYLDAVKLRSISGQSLVNGAQY
jgi:hypothetical protein